MDADSHTAECREDRILRAMPLVRKIAGSLFKLRSFDGVPFDDYMQWGSEGLIQAVDAYDPGQGAAFETYAGHRIRGAILSGLEKATEINQQVTTLKRLSKERLDSLTDHMGTPAPDADPSRQAFARLLEVAVGLAVAFMLDDTAMHLQEDEASTAARASHWNSGPSNLSFKQLQARLIEAMGQLNEKERRVIERHYFEHGAFEQIAQEMALTKGRISQLHKQALMKLRGAIRVGSSFELLG